MQSILSKSSIKKALAASFIALSLCSNLALSSRKEGKMVDDRLHAATSRFAFKLYDQIIKQRNGKNTFVSPASVMLALAMTYNGADGTTREAMYIFLPDERLCLKSQTSGLDTVSTGSGSDLVSDQLAIFPNDS